MWNGLWTFQFYSKLFGICLKLVTQLRLFMKSTVQGSLSASAGELPVLRPRPLPPTASHGTGAKSAEVTSKSQLCFSNVSCGEWRSYHCESSKARFVISVASHGPPWGMRASIVPVDGESATGCEPPAPQCETKAETSAGKHRGCSTDAGCSTDSSRSEAWPESRALQKYQPLEWMRIRRATPLNPIVKYI